MTQSLDCRLPKAQVHMDAKATPRQKSYTSQLATEIKGKKKKRPDNVEAGTRQERSRLRSCAGQLLHRAHCVTIFVE